MCFHVVLCDERLGGGYEVRSFKSWVEVVFGVGEACMGCISR